MKKSVAILDEDLSFTKRVEKILEKNGYLVTVFTTTADLLAAVVATSPDFIFLGVRLQDGHGADVLAKIQSIDAKIRVCMVTGYGSIAGAVSFLKAGAWSYVDKQTFRINDLESLIEDGVFKAPPKEIPMSANRVRWEYINTIFESCQHNVSETARQLGMHRRTLQRILSKRSPA